MPLGELLEDSSCNATSTLLSFLGWEDAVAFAITSTQLFLQVKAIIQKRCDDISCGSSQYPIPCDSAHRPLHGVQQATSGGSSKSSKIIKWSLGGPVPPSFMYLNEAIHAFDDSGADELEGCACFGGCGVDDTLCPCVRLNVAVQSGPAPLFECHSSCTCGIACRLRATQRGAASKVPPMLRLRYMGKKGWGAYSVDAIAGGTYVADYTGEVLPVPEARRRVNAYDRDGLNYVLTTQEFFQGGKQVFQTIVDATTCGNVSRFFNHSCEPTLSVFVIRRGSFLKPRLAFFAKDGVEPGRELTYDYGAVGAAGGTAVSKTTGVPQQELSCKPSPSRSASEPAESTRSGGGLSPASSSGDGGLQGDKMKEELASAVDGLQCHGGCDDVRSRPLSSRRRCLCGSRLCRGLLPCNRAIL
ncbi:unnamed protein product [Ectocarpus sp. 12 AP-2014]